MKTKNVNPIEVRNTLWNALTGSRPRTAKASPLLVTDGGRRRFLRLQLRMNEVLSRTNELASEFLNTKDESRKSRLQKLIDHQAERAEMFLKRFDRMIGADRDHRGHGHA